MNLTKASYLNSPEEYFLQFMEMFMIKVMTHSQSTFNWILKSLAGYWNYHFQSILAQKRDKTYEFDLGKLLEPPSRIVSTTYRNVHYNIQAPQPIKHFTAYSNLWWDIGITGFRAIQLNNKIRHMNLTKRSYLNANEEQFQEFIEMFIFNFRPIANQSFYRIFKSLAGYQNYNIQSILAQKRNNRPINMTWTSYLNTSEEQFQ